MPPHQRQAHLAADDIEIGLDLAFAERELAGELLTALARFRGDVLHNLPDPPKTLGHEALVVGEGRAESIIVQVTHMRIAQQNRKPRCVQVPRPVKGNWGSTARWTHPSE